MFRLDKFSLIITTRCNLKCKMCCEYIPQNKPFPDMTLDEERNILDAFFNTVDSVGTLHLTGGGEPFLHPQLPEMIDLAYEYADKFDKLMLFTNSTVTVNPELLSAIVRGHDKILVQLSQYGVNPEREQTDAKLLQDNGINCKVEKYYGDDQSFGGWIDFGLWESHGRTQNELKDVFQSCSVTNVLKGNWRTRDGKVHWCTRSQRGMELGFLPDHPNDYVDLFDGTSREEKQKKFEKIAATHHLLACEYCSGDAGTRDTTKRYKAAEQLEIEK